MEIKVKNCITNKNEIKIANLKFIIFLNLYHKMILNIQNYLVNL